MESSFNSAAVWRNRFVIHNNSIYFSRILTSSFNIINIKMIHIYLSANKTINRVVNVNCSWQLKGLIQNDMFVYRLLFMSFDTYYDVRVNILSSNQKQRFLRLLAWNVQEDNQISLFLNKETILSCPHFVLLVRILFKSV